MAFPALRTDNALIAFRKRLEECGWDLRRWRAGEVSKRMGPNGVLPRDLAEGFELLDAEGGAGWDLACKVGGGGWGAKGWWWWDVREEGCL
jgi:hypothetical protein